VQGRDGSARTPKRHGPGDVLWRRNVSKCERILAQHDAMGWWCNTTRRFYALHTLARWRNDARSALLACPVGLIRLLARLLASIWSVDESVNESLAIAVHSVSWSRRVSFLRPSFATLRSCFTETAITYVWPDESFVLPQFHFLQSHFTQLLPHFTLLFTNKPKLQSNVTKLLADVSKLFSHFSILLPDFTVLQSDFSFVQSDKPEL